VRIELHHATYRKRVVTHSYFGQRLTVCVADGLAEGYYGQDVPELERLKIMSGRKLRAGARVFDLGSHVGVRAMALARLVGPTGQVIGVEPNPHSYRSAVRNKGLNDLSQLEFLHAACSDHSGPVNFGHGQVGEPRGWFFERIVDGLTIDALMERYGRPDNLFIDVEGFECQALDGAAATLATNPDVFLEVHVGEGLEKLGGSIERVTAHFPPDRYTLLASRPFEPFVPFSPSLDFIHEYFFMLALSRDG
jgi:FkbM family methyltransferase